MVGSAANCSPLCPYSLLPIILRRMFVEEHPRALARSVSGVVETDGKLRGDATLVACYQIHELIYTILCGLTEETQAWKLDILFTSTKAYNNSTWCFFFFIFLGKSPRDVINGLYSDSIYWPRGHRIQMTTAQLGRKRVGLINYLGLVKEDPGPLRPIWWWKLPEPYACPWSCCARACAWTIITIVPWGPAPPATLSASTPPPPPPSLSRTVFSASSSLNRWR